MMMRTIFSLRDHCYCGRTLGQFLPGRGWRGTLLSDAAGSSAGIFLQPLRESKRVFLGTSGQFSSADLPLAQFWLVFARTGRGSIRVRGGQNLITSSATRALFPSPPRAASQHTLRKMLRPVGNRSRERGARPYRPQLDISHVSSGRASLPLLPRASQHTFPKMWRPVGNRSGERGARPFRPQLDM